jgi:hypothetical protein
MENKVKYLVLLLAVLIAVILYYSGFKKLKFKKKNFFYTSLLIALTFMGCNFSESNASGQKNDDPKNNPMPGKDDPEYIKELNKTSEWKEFKAFWKSIDQIEAAEGVTHDSYRGYMTKTDGDYGSTYKISDSLYKKTKSLEEVLKSLTEKKLLDTLESRLLSNMCYDRIDYVCYGFRSMYTRMIALPGIYEKEKTMARFEFRIDTLISLQKKGSIDSSEMNKVLMNIQSDIKSFSVLDILGKRNMLKYYSYHYDYDNPNPQNDTLKIIEKSILDFENSYSDFMKKYEPSASDKIQKDLFAAYVSTKIELDGFMENYQRFCTIINDLIMND